MIDGLKCSCPGVGADWSNNQKLDFRITVSESTGEIPNPKKEAKSGGFRFIQSPSGCSIAGSLHRHKNPDGNNHDDFTFSQLVATIDGLQDNFGIVPSETTIHSVEIGVNLQLEYSPRRILKNAIYHKDKPFTHLDRADRNIGLVCSRTEYDVKLYHKSYQCRMENCKPNTLRYEIKVKRMRAIEQYGIRTLADLQDAEKVARLVGLLLERLSEIVFFDFGHPTDGMTKFQLLSWQQYSNPNYWGSLNRNTLYKARKRFEELSQRYGAENIGAKLAEFVLIKYIELMEFKQKNWRLFHQFAADLKAQFPATFSHLEYMLESVAGGDTQNTKDTEREKEGDFAVSKTDISNFAGKRFCVICGRDISHQKKGSRFCSERDFGKEAKRCRNRDSNRRMIIKRRIKKAKMNEYFLRITYTDTDGASYTDTLAASEISPTREWLDRVTNVEVCKEPPETLTGNEAREFLTNNQGSTQMSSDQKSK